MKEEKENGYGYGYFGRNISNPSKSQTSRDTEKTVTSHPIAINTFCTGSRKVPLVFKNPPYNTGAC